jgi:hypothetical protein
MDLPPPFPTTDRLVECINHPVMGELVIKKIEAVNTRWKKQGRGKRREGRKGGRSSSSTYYTQQRLGSKTTTGLTIQISHFTS